MARKRNLDAAASPGKRYQTEREVIQGRPRFRKTKDIKKQTPDTRSGLPWEAPNG